MRLPSGSHLVLRGHTFFYRVRVPVEIARRIRRWEVVRTLGTKDARDARFLAARVTLAITGLWSAVETVRSIEEAEPLIQAWFKDAVEKAHFLLRSGDFGRAMAHDQTDVHEAREVSRDLTIEDVERRLDVGSEEFQRGDYSQGAVILESILDDAGIRYQRDSRYYDLACRRVMLAIGEIDEARMRWAQGNVGFEPTMPPPDGACTIPAAIEPQATGTAVAAILSARATLTLQEAVDNFVARRRRESPTSQKNLDHLRGELRFLTDCLGPATDVKSITREQAGDVFNAIRSLPPRFRAHPDLQGLSMYDAAKEAASINLPLMHWRTVRGYLGTFRSLFEELETDGSVDANLFLKMKTKVVASLDDENEKGFEDDELETIFQQPVFMGAKSDMKALDPGSFMVSDWRFWAPIIALLTSARIGDIAQLRSKDIILEDGIWVVSINREDGKTTKTVSSIRRIPIHSELLRLGILGLKADREGCSHLLPSIPKPIKGSYGKGASKWMCETFLPKTFGEKRKGLGFHSFRHNHRTLLRTASVEDSNADKLLGHRGRTVGANYGRYPLQKLKENLETIRLPESLKRIPPRF